jgi:hypothetical protein
MPTQPADPALRRRTWLLVALVLAVSSMGFFWLQAWIADLESRPPPAALAALLSALRICTVGIVVLLVGCALYLWSFARRVARDGRFPPRGQRVIRDTPILEGTAARRRARILRALAVLLVLSSVALLALTWRLAAMLTTAATP